MANIKHVRIEGVQHQIIDETALHSFEDAALTGAPTTPDVDISDTTLGNRITNAASVKSYVDQAIAEGGEVLPYMPDFTDLSWAEWQQAADNPAPGPYRDSDGNRCFIELEANIDTEPTSDEIVGIVHQNYTDLEEHRHVWLISYNPTTHKTYSSGWVINNFAGESWSLEFEHDPILFIQLDEILSNFDLERPTIIVYPNNEEQPITELVACANYIQPTQQDGPFIITLETATAILTFSIQAPMDSFIQAVNTCTIDVQIEEKTGAAALTEEVALTSLYEAGLVDPYANRENQLYVTQSNILYV